MKKTLIIITFFISIFTFAQIEKLSGKWILDRINYKDGTNLEINSPYYSFFSKYEFRDNYIYTGTVKQKITVDSKQIKSDFRTLNYFFVDKYLILEDINDKEKKVFVFLRPNDFINRYPEFTPKREMRNGKEVLICNEVFEPNFNYEDSYNDFFNRNTPQGNSKDDIDLFFKIEYILTKDNKIDYIKVLDSKTPSYDSNYISALKKAEIYYENPFNEDILITKEVQFLKWKNDLTNKEEINLYDIRRNILQYYEVNKFEEITKEYEKLKSLKIGENRFNSFFEEAFIKSGIAFLALNNNEKACECFEKAGDKTNFKVRNYLINFCNKSKN